MYNHSGAITAEEARQLALGERILGPETLRNFFAAVVERSSIEKKTSFHYTVSKNEDFNNIDLMYIRDLGFDIWWNGDLSWYEVDWSAE